MPYELERRSEPAAIDAAWMTDALEQAGVARGATITELRLEGLIGTGQMGRNARYSLTWDAPEGRPASVVGKFPTDDPTARATAFDNDNYLKEWHFYTQIQPTVSVRVPTVWVAEFDGAAQSFVFIMEDLRESRQGDQFHGLTADEAALAVEQAVGFHAPRWADDSLIEMFGDSADDTATRLQMIYAMTMEGTIDRLGPDLDDDVIQLVRDFAPLVQRWTYGLGTPWTLAHMDYRPDNFLFAAGPDAPPLVVVDWQTITYGLGSHDIAYMIGGGFEPEQRASVERALVDDYGEQMRAVGIAYDADDCWRDYRLSSLWGVIMSVIATMLAEETERGNRMLTTMLSRHGRHALDVEALALLS